MIRVTYFYSACVALETSDVRIICDPWFTDGIYDGSWYLYPKLQNPVQKLGRADFIYVSHIHPDHYDSDFLKEYLAAYPKTRVIVAPFKQNFLSLKMKNDGIPHEILEDLKVGETSIRLFLNDLNPDDIDSALAMSRKSHSVVNMNDNLFNAEQIGKIRDFCTGKIKIALLGYTGAGPYPQTYYTDPAILTEKANAKKEQFFTRYREMRDSLKPEITIPFAGKYILGGALADLNPYRGVADATEVSKFDPHAVVLADGGEAWIDTDSLTASKVRTEPYEAQALKRYCEEIGKNPMKWQEWIQIPQNALPLQRLLPKAYQNALKRSQCEDDYFFCIRLPSERWFVVNARKESQFFEVAAKAENFSPRSEIEIDSRYLFGLLTGVFHWNNAEVGSQYRTTRVPDVFQRHVQGFLNFFHV